MPMLSCKQSVGAGQVTAKQCSRYREPWCAKKPGGGAKWLISTGTYKSFSVAETQGLR